MKTERQWLFYLCLHCLSVFIVSLSLCLSVFILSHLILLIEEVHSAMICNDRIEKRLKRQWRFNDREIEDWEDSIVDSSIHCLSVHSISIFIVFISILSLSSLILSFYLNHCLCLLIIYDIAEWTSSINSIRWDKMKIGTTETMKTWDNSMIARQWRLRWTKRQWRQRDNYCLHLNLCLHYLSVFIISLSSLSLTCLQSIQSFYLHCLSVFIISLSSLSLCLHYLSVFIVSNLSSIYSIILSSLSLLILLIEEVHSAMWYNDRIEKIEAIDRITIEFSSSLNSFCLL